MTNPTKTILIVDDQEITRLGLRMLVAQARPDNEILESADGAGAVESAKAHSPSLIVMSTRLPNVDGITAARTIKEDAKAISILMLSTHINRTELLEVFKSGAEGYCSKESGADVLSSAINAVIKGALWIAPEMAEETRNFFTEEFERSKDYEWSQTITTSSFLSDRELEVLSLLIDGLSNKEMADRLGVRTETIKTHMRHVMEKLAVTDRTQAAIKAIRYGLLKKR